MVQDTEALVGLLGTVLMIQSPSAGLQIHKHNHNSFITYLNWAALTEADTRHYYSMACKILYLIIYSSSWCLRVLQTLAISPPLLEDWKLMPKDGASSNTLET